MMKGKTKAIIWMAVAFVFLAVAIIVGINVFNTQQAITRQDAIREAGLRPPESGRVDAVQATPSPDIPESPDIVESSDQPDYPYELPSTNRRQKQSKPNERFINFEELWELNPDVIAWIEIPGTVIDYPIVSTLCNQFYIDHDLLGHRTGYGALFTDIRNNENWQDPFIIVYGHNMRDGRKFSDLHRFRGRWVFDTFRIIHIYTPHGQFDYKIFAAYERDNEHLMAGRDFRDINTMREHLDSVRNTEWLRSIIEMDDVTEYDNILTLSTCVGADDRRFIVQAVFIEPDSDS